MGLQPRPEICDYWSTKDAYHTPWFSKVMARDRFEATHHTMLHVSDNDKKNANDKIEPFMNELIHQFQAASNPFQEEMVIKYNGRWKNKQYNPNKPSKHHMKTYGVCDSATGYAFNILTYFGSDTSHNLAMSDFGNSEIFEYLLLPLGSRHNVFAEAGCPHVLENLEMSWNLPFSEFCPGILLLQFNIFSVIISVRVPCTLQNLENSLLSLILFDILTLDFLCL